MKRTTAFAIWLPLFILLSPPLLGQGQPYRWAISGGAHAFRFAPNGEQAFPNNQPLRPGASFGVTRYLRPGFDFHTDILAAPALTSPVTADPQTGPYLAFRYQLRIKLNNGIFLREDARIAPYASLGAGGSYHAGVPDAWSPFGAGVMFRIGNRSALDISASRNVSWNGSPQVWNAGVSYVYRFRMKDPVPVIQQETAPEELIAANQPPDSDEDGVPDTEDNCPYEPGLIQDNGCPPADTAITTVDEAPEQVSANVEADSTDMLASVAQPAIAIEEAEDIPPVVSTPEEEESEPEEVQDDMPVLLEDTMLAFEEPATEPESEPPLTPEPTGNYPCQEGISPKILFARGSSDLTDSDREMLDAVGQLMQECPGLRLKLEGHARESGGSEANLVLSIKRAYNIKYYLVYQHGISQARIDSRGSGNENSAVSEPTVTFHWKS